MKYTLTLTTLCLLTNAAYAQDHGGMDHSQMDHSAHQTVPVQAWDDGTKPKPDYYQSPPVPIPAGQDIRKYAIDQPGDMASNFDVQTMHDDENFAQFLGNRLEHRSDGKEQVVLWDFNAWYGGDYNKVFIESEGEWNTEGNTESANLEVYWNHSLTSFWDTQLGIRQDFAPGDNRTFLAGGVQGMSPYIVEIDATAYVSDEGDVSAVFEFEKDFNITQRLIIQPRLETEIAVQYVPEYNIGSGITGIETGLRLRYSITRKFEPYLGVSWERAIGETASYMRADGEDINSHVFCDRREILVLDHAVPPTSYKSGGIIINTHWLS